MSARVAASERITAAQVAHAMKQILLKAEIENDNWLTNEDRADMHLRRNVLINRLVNVVEPAVDIAKDITIADDAACFSRTRNAAGPRNAVESPKEAVNTGPEEFPTF